MMIIPRLKAKALKASTLSAAAAPIYSILPSLTLKPLSLSLSLGSMKHAPF